MNKFLHFNKIFTIFFILGLFFYPLSAQHGRQSVIRGTVKNADGKTVDYATVYIKDTSMGTQTDQDGNYFLRVMPGSHTLCVQDLGYVSYEKQVEIKAHERLEIDIVLEEKKHSLDEVVIEAKSAVQLVNESAYNVIAIDAASLHNTTLDLAGALAKIPGVKLRESGGVGSDMRFSLDGFSGKHIKFFIDGVPMEGIGSSFDINNIPINFAERIEVYRGVVPVGFGADALGGVVNIVTGSKRRTFVDASYSFGSFNTHKSYVNAGHTTKEGLMFEINAFQNYSDNNYYVHTAVKDLEAGQIDDSKIEKVKRFHDTYHNETVIAKVGLIGKKFADRLVFGINLSQYDKQIQTGVVQEVVFGRKKSRGNSVMPSLEYRKRNFFTKGLDIGLTANYNRNTTQNIDTATYIFNWRGESKYNDGKLGEQNYQNAKFDDDNWNGTFNAVYRIGTMHTFTLNHVLTAFDRSTRGNSENQSASSTYDKISRKNITGLSYLLNREYSWNVSVFGKYYNQYSKGPRNQSTSGFDYVLFSESVDALGYGLAGTYFFLKDFQAKVSYEKTHRLPSTNELFGDEDLELGALGIKPEKSHNYNLSLSYLRNFDEHSVYIEGGFLYRDTKDYIRRRTDMERTGGLKYASHENHGRVKTIGLSVDVRYTYSDKVTVGGNLTSQNARDNEKYEKSNSLQPSTTYKQRVPNIPYFFGNADVSYNFHNLFNQGNMFTITYSTFYVHKFPLHWEKHGTSEKKMIVPEQFSHDLSLLYSIQNGRYNFSFECKNFTDEKLYDNYRLQKAGRAFYGKFRYFFGR